ncbi:hypothetical protein AMELA_G00134290 [Ameiurus melas]|uniref:Uncharacterized protein n=1 Tax=Ameiurus melas TaxID=219545 RepID=A0A7J6AJT7_AMEME|nr:hypothetical protein AMELA_G00134290 [Ameiurus melas]
MIPPSTSYEGESSSNVICVHLNPCSAPRPAPIGPRRRRCPLKGGAVKKLYRLRTLSSPCRKLQIFIGAVRKQRREKERERERRRKTCCFRVFFFSLKKILTVSP